MAQKFEGRLTQAGLNKFAAAQVTSSKVELHEIAIGDAANPLDINQTSLVSEKWRGLVTSLEPHPSNPHWMIASTIVPANVGGWYVREAGIYDDEGDLILIANVSPSYKPLITEGAAKEQRVQLVLELQNADTVALSLDPHILSASKQDIEDAIVPVTQQLAQKAEEITPLLFGAVGDGIVDDYQALVDTFNYAMAHKVPVNLLDDKLYLVASKPVAIGENLNLFNIHAKIQIHGLSTIKIGAIGDYESVFRLRANSSGSKFKDFTLDENTENNNTTVGSVSNLDNQKGKRRIAFYGWNLSRIRELDFENVKIINGVGVWQLQARADKVNVVNCTFDYAKDNGGQPLTYDRTCLYAAGDSWIIRDSDFLGGDLARTCIETHGSNITVENNLLVDYTSPLYIVNDPESQKENLGTINIIGNKIKCRKGLKFWLAGNNTSFEHINVLNNVIESTESLDPVIETQQYPGSNISIKSIKIQGNTLSLVSDTMPFVKFHVAVNAVVANPLSIDELVIQDNLMTGEVLNVFRMGVQPNPCMVIKKTTFKNNVINITKLHAQMFYILDVPNAFHDVKITSNDITLHAVANIATRYIIMQMATNGRTTAVGVTLLENNNYTFKDAFLLSFSNHESLNLLTANEFLNVDIMTLTDPQVLNGVVKDHLNQRMEFINGVVKKYFKSNTTPSSGRYRQGDYAFADNYIVAGTSGAQYIVKGYSCVAAGTPGSWREDRALTGS